MAPIVQGSNYLTKFLTGQDFELIAEALWGNFTTFSATGFWAAFNGIKAAVQDLLYASAATVTEAVAAS